VARSTRSPARLVVALSVALLLAIFLLYTSIAGGSTPQVTPSTLAAHAGKATVVGEVVGPVRGDSHTRGGLRFALRDIDGKGPAVPVVLHGSTPDLFKVGRHVVATGELRGGTFAARQLQTKCPSKYAPAKKT
jgi:cytochrome c-type biogenesis protein CcmE